MIFQPTVRISSLFHARKFVKELFFRSIPRLVCIHAERERERNAGAKRGMRALMGNRIWRCWGRFLSGGGRGREWIPEMKAFWRVYRKNRVPLRPRVEYISSPFFFLIRTLDVWVEKFFKGTIECDRSLSVCFYGSRLSMCFAETLEIIILYLYSFW